MKKSKILIILGIIVAIVIIVVAVVIKMQNEKISYDKKIYYEYSGSSSVNRKSTIYSDNDNWTIVTEYFNSGKNKTITKKLNDDDKKKILDKINENSSASTSDNLDHESDDILERKVGGTMFYAMEYINSDEGKEITPVNLEELNMVKNVFDVNV